MDYLASKKVMHGDLACRNFLLAADNVVKICDFGLAKNIYKTNNYQKKSDGPLPVKWLAIVCIRDRIFSTQSDVWAFGEEDRWKNGFQIFLFRDCLREPFKKKREIVWYLTKGGVPHPPLARFGQFPVFSCEILYCFKMILKV